MSLSRLLVALVAIVFSSACGGSSATEPDSTGSGGGAPGAGGTSAGGGSGGAGAAPPACTVTFKFTTLDNHGRYSPSNVSAVWVTDSSGAFVRTLEENGYVRQSHLVQWEQASRGSKVDAVTGATNRSFRAHQATWDCTDAQGNVVPLDGHALNAEFASDNGGLFGVPAPFLTVPFGPGTTTVPDEQFFTGIEVTAQ